MFYNECKDFNCLLINDEEQSPQQSSCDNALLELRYNLVQTREESPNYYDLTNIIIYVGRLGPPATSQNYSASYLIFVEDVTLKDLILTYCVLLK